ncbi:hypothetical protein AB0425_25730 [Actinosynnema sp. NPDC051121]
MEALILRARRYAALVAGAAVIGLTTTNTAAFASPGEAVGLTASEQQAAITQTVQAAKERWGLTLDPADYKVVDTGTGIAVQPQGMPNVEVVKHKNADGSSGAVTASLDVAADPARLDEQLHSQAEISWYAPRCADWITDEDDVGKMLKCWQWGRIPYPNGERNEIYKAYSSCLPTGSGTWLSREIDECYDNAARDRDGAPFTWHDYSPRSTTTLSTCSDIPLSVTAYGFTAGTVVRTCQKLVPEWGAEPGDFGTRWIGDAWKSEDVRETGHMMALSSPLGYWAGLTANWGYTWSSCSPGGILDPCG